MLAALHAAITSGQISLTRINQSVARILALKVSYGILPLRGAHPPRIKTHLSGSLTAPEADLPRQRLTP